MARKGSKTVGLIISLPVCYCAARIGNHRQRECMAVTPRRTRGNTLLRLVVVVVTLALFLTVVVCTVFVVQRSLPNDMRARWRRWWTDTGFPFTCVSVALCVILILSFWVDTGREWSETFYAIMGIGLGVGLEWAAPRKHGSREWPYRIGVVGYLVGALIVVWALEHWHTPVNNRLLLATIVAVGVYLGAGMLPRPTKKSPMRASAP